MNWLLNRLGERTTWLGIFIGAGLLGMNIEPEFRELIINAILAVVAVVSFVFRESHRERQTDLPAIETRSKRVGEINSKTDLPKIELQSRSESSEKRTVNSASKPDDSGADLPVFDGEPVQRVRRTGLPPDAFLKGHEQSVRSGQDGYNG